MQIIFLFGVQIGFQRQMGHSDNRVHGGTDFMTHVGQKVTFGLVGLVSDLFGFNEFIFHAFAFGNII